MPPQPKSKKTAKAPQLNTSLTHSESAALEAKYNKLAKNFNELAQSQQFISAKYDEIIKEMKEQKRSIEQINTLRLELAAAHKKCSELNTVVEMLSTKQNSHEQVNLNSNALVRGISVEDDAISAVKKIAQIVEVPIEESDLVSVQRQTYNNKESAIIAKFKSMEKRRAFVRASKQKKLSSQMFGYTGEVRPIYVDEQLTSQTFKLFKETKKLKRIGVKFVWIANGEVLIRETEQAKIHSIKQQSQLTELENDIVLRKNNTKEITVKPQIDTNSNTVSDEDRVIVSHSTTSKLSVAASEEIVMKKKKKEIKREVNAAKNENTVSEHDTVEYDEEEKRSNNIRTSTLIRRQTRLNSSSVLCIDSDLDTSELEFVDAK